MCTCTNETSNEEFQATVKTASYQFSGECVWVSALSTDTRNFSLQDSELLQPINDLHLDSIDIKYAQTSDPILSYILRLKETGKKPPRTTHISDRRSKTFLREWDKLYFDSNGILRRKTSEYEQIVLPMKYRCLV